MRIGLQDMDQFIRPELEDFVHLIQKGSAVEVYRSGKILIRIHPNKAAEIYCEGDGQVRTSEASRGTMVEVKVAPDGKWENEDNPHVFGVFLIPFENRVKVKAVCNRGIVTICTIIPQDRGDGSVLSFRTGEGDAREWYGFPVDGGNYHLWTRARAGD